MLSVLLSRKLQIVFYPWMTHMWNFCDSCVNEQFQPQILEEKMTKDLQGAKFSRMNGMVFRSLQVFQSGIQSERCGSKIRDQLEHAQNPLAPPPPWPTHPRNIPWRHLQLPEENLKEVSPFQQEHLPPGGGNLEYLGSVGDIWWDKLAPMPQGRARAAGCAMDSQGSYGIKGN